MEKRLVEQSKEGKFDVQRISREVHTPKWEVELMKAKVNIGQKKS